MINRDSQSEIQTKYEQDEGGVLKEGMKCQRYEQPKSLCTLQKVRSVQGTMQRYKVSKVTSYLAKGTKCPGYEVAKVESVLTPF